MFFIIRQKFIFFSHLHLVNKSYLVTDTLGSKSRILRKNHLDLCMIWYLGFIFNCNKVQIRNSTVTWLLIIHNWRPHSKSINKIVKFVNAFLRSTCFINIPSYTNKLKLRFHLTNNRFNIELIWQRNLLSSFRTDCICT